MLYNESAQMMAEGKQPEILFGVNLLVVDDVEQKYKSC